MTLTLLLMLTLLRNFQNNTKITTLNKNESKEKVASWHCFDLFSSFSLVMSGENRLTRLNRTLNVI